MRASSLTSEPRPRALLLSAYDVGSHRRWRQQLVASQPGFDWQVLTLPPRYFRWRIRGNALSWLDEPLLQERWDLLVVTSMVDLATLKGFHPRLACVPTLLYMHENQFAYPVSGQQHSSIDPQLVNLYSAIAADRVAFNSEWNRRSFFDAVAQLLQKLPDAIPAGVVDSLRAKSQVLPVPIDDGLYAARKPAGPPAESQSAWARRWNHELPGAPVRLVWASRWEYDKGPAHLLAFLEEIEARQLDYRLCVLGERFRTVPDEFGLIETRFSHRLAQFGFAQSREEYEGWLRSADVVFSSALHEFQGIAILEAVACGCVPLLPDRLSYSELFDSGYLYTSSPEDPQREAVAAADRLQIIARERASGQCRSPDVSRFSVTALKAEYHELLTALLP